MATKKTTVTKTPVATTDKTPDIKVAATPKTTTPKTTTAKTETAKAETAKAATPKTTTAKKATEKPAAKKSAAKKSTAKKDIKMNVLVEYYGKQVEEQTIIANVKKAWTKKGNRVGDIKTMELYIKPEEDAVYYVINGTETGGIAF